MRKENSNTYVSKDVPTRRPRHRAATLPALIGMLALGSAQDARSLVDGAPEFGYPAVGVLLVNEPGNQFPGDWVTFCSAFLIHERVLLTAGHCVQQVAALLSAGVFIDARVSLQQSPFDASTYFAGDPDASGWLEIEELVNNPDNPDWLNIPEIEANWGTWHDQGAIVLAKPVKHIEPLNVPWVPGSVELLTTIQCEWLAGLEGFCEPLLVAYGLQSFPPAFAPNQRQSRQTNYHAIDPLFIHTRADPGDACLGDSGGAVIMKRGRNGRELVVALMSSPVAPFSPTNPPPCAVGSLQYRLDTKSSVQFMWDVILDAAWGQGHEHPRFRMLWRAWDKSIF